MTIVWKVLVSFLIGSISFAKVAMLGTGIDITKVGSGNPGFRNVSRHASRWRSAICLLGDSGKGYLALLLLGSADMSPASLWIIGIASVMGHCWSPFLGFNGGKGVATTFGALLFLEPYITLACLPLYPLLRFAGGKLRWKQEGAIASLTTSFVITASVTVLKGIVPGLFACVMLAIVVVRHAPNLQDLMASKGEGPSAGSKSRSADAQAAPRQSR